MVIARFFVYENGRFVGNELGGVLQGADAARLELKID
jgi:hypothetical protein